jgi:hypothetical protein
MRPMFRVVAPLALVSFAGGAFLLISGLAEKQSTLRLVIALVMIAPLAALLARRSRDWASTSREARKRIALP